MNIALLLLLAFGLWTIIYFVFIKPNPTIFDELEDEIFKKYCKKEQITYHGPTTQ